MGITPTNQLQELHSQAIPRAIEIHSLPFCRASGRFAWPRQCWPQNGTVFFWEAVGCTLCVINQSQSSFLKGILTPVTSVVGILHRIFLRFEGSNPKAGMILQRHHCSRWWIQPPIHRLMVASYFKHAPKIKAVSLWDLLLSSGSFAFSLSLWTSRTCVVATTQDTSRRSLRGQSKCLYGTWFIKVKFSKVNFITRR